MAEMGLHVLAADGLRRLVVFPDDTHLERLRTRIEAYAESAGARFQKTAALDAISPLGRQDRIGRRLAEAPLEEGETAALDVELWHSGDQGQMGRLVMDLRRAIEPDGEVTDQYVGISLCLLRVRLTPALLDELLELDHVKEIDRRASPTFELIDVVAAPIEAFSVGDRPEDTAPGVIIVDSGVAGAHPVLAPVFADGRTYVTGDTVGAPSHGHGTWVAGIAAYGDIADAVSRRRFDPSTLIYSAKVMQTAHEYDPDQLVETQLRSLVADLTSDHPNIKVINLSLGDSRTPYTEGSLQFRLAAVVDELAYDYRDRELVFVISAGNQSTPLDGEAAVNDYPSYLFDDSSRVIDPATSLLAITVGGLSAGEARQLPLAIETTDRGIAERGWPSAFTRTGPGHGGAIKPDLVEFAGDARFSMGRILQLPGGSGLATTSDRFGPPAGELFRTVAGTSFAAPRVAHQAARLFGEFPQASSNLIRALLADSAKVPASRPPAFMDLAEHDPKLMNVYGYGQPDLESATWSAANRVVLLADDAMPIDHVYLYEIPQLPDQFREAPGRGRISVALAYDPPSRHTRSKDYLGVRMQFALFRNSPAADVYDAVRAWSQSEAEALEGGVPGRTGLSTVSLDPGPITRNRGSLQRGVEFVNSTQWRYDGQPLVLAVTSQRRWAPPSVDRQRFAVVVSVRHDNPRVDLHTSLSLRARAYQQVRVRLPG